MKKTNGRNDALGGFASGATLGGTVSQYLEKQNIYKQGTPAPTLFYIQEGGVAGYPLRMSTAVALTSSSIRTIKKEKMLQMLRTGNATSNSLVAYLLSSAKNFRDQVSELLTSSAEQRLARVLLRLSHLDKSGPPLVEIPAVNHQVLAEMVGTTRPRINFFMNRFRRKGYINYDGGLEVRQSLRKVLRRG